MEPSDLELWRSAAAGDHRAFHALVDRHAAGLFRTAMSLSGNRMDAEDICQETFAAAFRGLGSFDGRASVKTWLTRVLMRISAKSWRKRRSEATVSLDGAARTAGGRKERVGADGEVSVPPEAEKVDQRLDVMEVVRSLPPEFRDTIVLREIQGMSYEEIAQALGVPRGTVESRLYRARAELRRRLTGY